MRIICELKENSQVNFLSFEEKQRLFVVLKYEFSLFTAITTTKEEFRGERVERPRLIRRNTWTKLEGDLFSETTNRTEYREFHDLRRTETVRRREDNLTVGGTFQVIFAMSAGHASKAHSQAQTIIS